ncbi:protein-disulfide reductase [Flavobacteriaceae bacterium Ap0902]|nr:protein-disulfide reductase [Flavobacteriaceae bacterium Ap0902]
MAHSRKLKFTFLLVLIHLISFSQILDPVDWDTETVEVGDNEFELRMTAQLEDGWHMYSITQKEGGIGLPTEFTWKENPKAKKVGAIEERGKLLNVFNELISERELYFGKTVTFVQKYTASEATKVEGEIMYQVCDDQQCLPPEYKTFTFELNPSGIINDKDDLSADESTEDDFNETLPVVTDSLENASKEDSANIENEDQTIVENKDEPKTKKAAAPNANRSFWEIFIFGLLGGFAALLMPCIFPMIPLTVSLFTKQSKSRSKGITKAVIYGLSIIVIYVGLGLIITAIFGAGALNEFATNPWVNIAFFILFVIFAVSFFGAFEITLPSKWINKADKSADKGGYIGVFFMALTLVLVSFSCTGPIIGTLLVDSASSGALLGPAIGMFGFALALALPFTLFAIFPSWLNSLPSSGGWLNTVKVSLGFIELAFALKFLSNADLVWQAHWLERELFLAIWLAIFLAMALYLLNIYRLSHDSNTERIGWPRLLFGILTLMVVFYILPGLWGAPLKLLSGLTPPKNYAESPMGFMGSGSALTNNSELPENAHYGPHQIPAFHDIEEAFAFAQEVGKPVLIDFTGDACANCRKVEDNVWSDPRVQDKLRNEVVLASLYVDRRIDLPAAEQVYSEAKGRNLRTIGDKWSAYQIENFNSNSQPLYIIVDEDLNRFNEPMGTELDIETYLDWLDRGINNFDKNK